MSKVALCLFGIPRVLEENYKSLKDHFPDFDVFAHFWTSDQELKDWIKTASPKLIFLENLVDTRYHAYDEIVHNNNFDLKNKFMTQGLQSFGEQITAPGWSVNPKNILSMWNSMSKSVSLALSYADTNNLVYDRIVLVRPDVVPSGEFDITKTYVGDVHRFLMPNYHPGSRISLWTPDHIISMSSRAARVLTFLPQFSYHYYYSQDIPIIPEIMLGSHMVSQKMKVETSGMYYRSAYKFWNDDGKI
jgi:hypothetical protein